MGQGREAWRVGGQRGSQKRRTEWEGRGEGKSGGGVESWCAGEWLCSEGARKGGRNGRGGERR